MAQAVSLGDETGSNFQIKFDYTAVAGAAPLNIQVAAYKNGGTALATDRFFTGLNFISTQGRAIGGGEWVDLNDGSTATGNANAGVFTVAGTVGVSQSQTLDLNFGSKNIEDYDYIAIKFWSGDATVAGAIIDNVQLVPEPSSYALLGGLCALGFVMVRRRK